MATDDKGHDDMNDETPGQMNIETQEKTFEGFTKILTYGALTVIFILIFIALIGA